MHVPTPIQLLTLWEWGTTRNPAERAIAILSLLYPDQTRDAIENFSAGLVGSRLVDLRRTLFGGDVTALTNCQQCGECIELRFDLSLLQSDVPEMSDDLCLDCDNVQVQFRLPTAADLLAISRADPSIAKRKLLKRCLLEVEPEEYSDVQSMPPEVVSAIIDRMQEADREIDTRLEVTCPSCEHDSCPRFDIIEFLWSEIDVWAKRILREVHTLASAYHWSEEAILSMSPWRRLAYMTMVRT